MQYKRMLHLIPVILTLGGVIAEPACSHMGGDMQLTAGGKTEQTRVHGEYLVTLAEGENIKVITELYERFGIKSAKELGNNLFLLTLKQDPGPERMEEIRHLDVRIKAVQPNFLYKADRPDRNKPQ